MDTEINHSNDYTFPFNIVNLNTIGGSKPFRVRGIETSNDQNLIN